MTYSLHKGKKMKTKINFWLKKEEKEQIKKLAKEARQSMTNFILYKIFNIK